MEAEGRLLVGDWDAEQVLAEEVLDARREYATLEALDAQRAAEVDERSVVAVP